jgi:nitrogen regulatory protein P-II 2
MHVAISLENPIRHFPDRRKNFRRLTNLHSLCNAARWCSAGGQDAPQSGTFLGRRTLLLCKNQGGEMKLLVAIIKPFKLDEVRDALSALGVQGMTVSEVQGFGRQKGHTEIYRGAEYTTSMVPKIKIEMAVSDELAPRVLETIEQTAKTGTIGDGKIFVLDLAGATRIRTGESDDAAL